VNQQREIALRLSNASKDLKRSGIEPEFGEWPAGLISGSALQIRLLVDNTSSFKQLPTLIY
jgi:hypothetical protein